MRLNYLYVERFMNLSHFEIELYKDEKHPSVYGEQLNLRFFVGPNGSGKSHILEALGLIFSSIIYEINMDLLFAIEYELQGRTVRIISTTNLPEMVLSEWFGGKIPEINSKRGIGVYIREQNQVNWIHMDNPRTELFCPTRVVAVASGPTSGFHWAMYERPLAYLVESVQGEWGGDNGLSLIEQKNMQIDARSRWDAMLDNPQTLVMNPQDSRYAVLATLLLETDRTNSKVIYKIIKESNVIPKLGSFSFIVSGDWREKLQEPLRSRFREFLRVATVRWVYPGTGIQGEASNFAENPNDFLAAYDVDSRMIKRFVSELNLTPIGLFLLLMACRRRGVIKDVHLGLIPYDANDEEKIDGLLPEDALSDGEYLRLGRYCLLLMLREERDCMILFDEPETHFNDLWKIDLVSDIVKLLKADKTEESGSHEVIIATHSAITLTDAESNQVYAFYKGNRVSVARTFGADTDDITRCVYGAKSAQGSFAVSLIEDAIKTGNTEMLTKLKEILAPGYYHFRVHEVLEELVRGGNHDPSDSVDR